jgi:hypothetical protein
MIIYEYMKLLTHTTMNTICTTNNADNMNYLYSTAHAQWTIEMIYQFLRLYTTEKVKK